MIPVYPWSSQLKKKDTVSIIAECKKASPSSGILRADYDPVEIASIYETNGVGAISVLTDETYFSGSVSHLINVSHAVAVPTIRKDFILDPVQIDEAYSAGASAILLIVRILDESLLKSLLAHAKNLGLGILVETHNAAEVKTALACGADTIGINTRDLDTFEIHPHLIEEIAPSLPDYVIRVAESGIQSFGDWQPYIGLVDSMLIGTYFMKADNLQSAFTNLLTKK